MHDAPISAKMLDIVNSGHAVEMDYSEADPTNTTIRFESVSDGNEGTLKELRIRDGDVTAERIIGQPKIENIVKNRKWSVVKND